MRLYVAKIDRHVQSRLKNSGVHSKAIKFALKGGHVACFEFPEHAFKITSLEGEQYKPALRDTAQRGNTSMLKKLRRVMCSIKEVSTRSNANSGLIRHEEVLIESMRDTDHLLIDAHKIGFLYNGGDFSAPTVHTHRRNRHMYECIAGCDLINHGTDPATRDRNGFTALYLACSRRVFCHEAIMEVHSSHGASTFNQTIGGLTLFHLATYHAPNPEVLVYLISLGSRQIIGAASEGGMSPPNLAITRLAWQNEQFDTLVVLLRPGADIKTKNSRGISPLEWGSAPRNEGLQTIWSGIDGVDLIAISYNSVTDIGSLWAVCSDVSPDTLPPRIEELSENSSITQVDPGKGHNSRS